MAELSVDGQATANMITKYMKSLGPISFPILANTAYSFADTISRAGEIPTNLSLPLDTAQAGLFYKFKPSYISS